jgi:hypothetical protein
MITGFPFEGWVDSCKRFPASEWEFPFEGWVDSCKRVPASEWDIFANVPRTVSKFIPFLFSLSPYVLFHLSTIRAMPI